MGNFITVIRGNGRTPSLARTRPNRPRGTPTSNIGQLTKEPSSQRNTHLTKNFREETTKRISTGTHPPPTFARTTSRTGRTPVIRVAANCRQYPLIGDGSRRRRRRRRKHTPDQPREDDAAPVFVFCATIAGAANLFIRLDRFESVGRKWREMASLGGRCNRRKETVAEKKRASATRKTSRMCLWGCNGRNIWNWRKRKVQQSTKFPSVLMYTLSSSSHVNDRPMRNFIQTLPKPSITRPVVLWALKCYPDARTFGFFSAGPFRRSPLITRNICPFPRGTTGQRSARQIRLRPRHLRRPSPDPLEIHPGAR